MNKLYDVLLSIIEETPTLAAFLPAIWVYSENPNDEPTIKWEGNDFFCWDYRRKLAAK